MTVFTDVMSVTAAVLVLAGVCFGVSAALIWRSIRRARRTR